MYYTAAAFMLCILIVNNDAFLQKPIDVQWKILAFVFVIAIY